MDDQPGNNRIVIVNQAVNYLTIGIANEFVDQDYQVGLITGSIHSQGEKLHPNVRVSFINRYSEQSLWKKFLNWMMALVRSLFLLLTRYRQYDILYISNPPMMYWLSMVLPNKFSILIWDVYPDTLQIFNMPRSHVIYRFWSKINRIVFKRAKVIFTIGNRISESIAQYVDANRIAIVPLWSIFRKEEIITRDSNPFIKEQNTKDKFVVQYSGNIGVTHEVEIILDVAELLLSEISVQFQIIGRGYRTADIRKSIEHRRLKNIVFLDFQSDDKFADSLSAADLGVVILDSRTAKGSVPSKTYNLMVFGKPILYIATRESELHDYAIRYENGRCFESDQITQMVSFIEALLKDKAYYNRLSINSIKASADYSRKNAGRFVSILKEAK